MLVDLRLIDGEFGEHLDVIAIDLSEAAAHDESLGLAAFGHAQFAVGHLGEQRDVAGQDADLALDRGDDDRVDRVAVDPVLRRDDLEHERHGAEAASSG